MPGTLVLRRHVPAGRSGETTVATILRRTGRTVLVLTAAGFAGAALVETPQMLIPAAAVGALSGVITYAVLVGPTPPPHALRRRAGAGAARIGGLAALLTLVVSGMAVLLGEATAPLLLLAVVIVVARSWRRIRPALTRLRAGGVPATARTRTRTRTPGRARPGDRTRRRVPAAPRRTARDLRDGGAVRDVAAHLPPPQRGADRRGARRARRPASTLPGRVRAPGSDGHRALARHGAPAGRDRADPPPAPRSPGAAGPGVVNPWRRPR